jgi:dihydrolipoamide dehydrogenase
MPQRITIIGGGPGGYAAAFDAADRGAEVTLVEKYAIGGTCLHNGCIPTKSFKASAEALETAASLNSFGVDLPTDCSPSINLKAVVERKNRIRSTLQGGLEKTCEKRNIRLIHGRARIIDSNTVEVTRVDGETQQVPGDAIIVATGSSVLELPSLPFDHTSIISSDDILNLQEVPASMAIVGGGVIGCELAFIFSAFGTKVTLVEGQDRLLPMPGIDIDSAKLIQRELKKHKVDCELGRTLGSVSVQEDGSVKAVVAASPFIENPTAKQLKEVEISVDKVVVCVGRTPNTSDLGLENTGVECDGRGWIVADNQMRTNVPNIYAIGDVLGPSKVMLAHVASMEGLCAVQNCLGREKVMRYSAVPSAIFTSPELGTVGLTEVEARLAGYEPVAHTQQFRELGKAQAMGSLAGFFKLIADASTGRLLGAQLAGEHATDMIAELTYVIQHGGTVHQIADTIHAHPTLAEGIFEAAAHLSASCGQDA